MGLADIRGWTVAHVAAMEGNLPEDFKHWEWADLRGSSVAHFAAVRGHLPKGFNLWDLKNGYGETVKEVYESNYDYHD